jgi:hypothetical protein
MSGIMNMLVAAKTTVAAAVDEFFNRVTLLLNTSSTNGAQNNTFLDSSSNNFTITRNGNTTQGTFTPFSQTGWGTYFDGSGDSFSVSTSTVLDLNGAIDFTIEAWVYLTGYGSTADMSLNIANKFSGAGGLGYSYGILGGGANQGKIQFYGAAGSVSILSTNVIPLNSWNHVAIVKNGTTYTHYLNGVANNSQTTATTLSASTNALVIGDYGYSDDFLGYMSNLRITKSGALYTGTFTPSTSPLTTTVSAGTVSLLTFQSNRFVDNSSNGFTLTPTGTPSVQAFSPFAPTAAYDAAVVGGSGYFDGTGDYLTLPYSSQLQFTGDFTIEFWAYPLTQVQSAAGVINNYSSWPSSTGFAIFCGHSSASSTKWCVALFGTFPAITSTNDFIKNAWSHIALVRNGTGTNNITLYVNGVASGTTTSNNTVTGTANNWWIGTTGDTVTQTFTGYLAGLRAINSAAYTSAFTPPTAPLAAGSNKLLLNYTNAGIFDSTAKNVLETVGNAQVSTTQAKFGTTSMYFDGTGDYLTLPVSKSFEFGSANWTIEFWLYVPSLPSTRKELLYLNANSSGYAAVALHICTNNKLGLSFSESGGSWRADDTTGVGSALTAATWQYVAVTRSGQNIQIYLDGTAQGSAYTTTAATTSLMTTYTLNQIATYNTASYQFNGYMDELRITIGQARTVTSVPTAAFPIQ